MLVALAAEGFRTFELTMTTPGALELLVGFVCTYPRNWLLVAIGRKHGQDTEHMLQEMEGKQHGQEERQGGGHRTHPAPQGAG